MLILWPDGSTIMLWPDNTTHILWQDPDSGGGVIAVNLVGGMKQLNGGING